MNEIAFEPLRGETGGTIAWRRPDVRTAGSAGGVKEAPRRRRGCLDAGEHPARLGEAVDPGRSVGCCLGLETIDQVPEVADEVGIVELGILLG